MNPSIYPCTNEQLKGFPLYVSCLSLCLYHANSLLPEDRDASP